MAFTITFTPAAGKALTLGHLKSIPAALAVDGAKPLTKESIRTLVLSKITDTTGKANATAAAWAAAGTVPKAGEDADLSLKIKGANGEHKSKLKVSSGEAEKLAVSYASTTVQNTCEGNDDFMKKIKSIIATGSSYSGGGPVPNLGNANHTHVHNSDGFAFRFVSGKLHIEATGIKNDKAKPGNCSYDWKH